MDKKTLGVLGFAGAALGAATVSAAAPKWAPKGSTIEKCAGIAANGKNDCVKSLKWIDCLTPSALRVILLCQP